MGLTEEVIKEMATEGPTHTIQINAFEAGMLLALIGELDQPKRGALSGVLQQLIALKKKAEEAAGVTKTLLPDGFLEIKDANGIRIIRPPYSWEVEGN